MNVAMMQPAFLPWQGFFELIDKSDVFIFLDDFQFSVQSYHQRNRLFTGPGKVDWYTMPVEKSTSFKAPLNRANINEAQPWRERLLGRIRQNYGRTPYYAELGPFVEGWLAERSPSVAAHNLAFILWAMKLMGIEREIRYSSAFASEAQRSQRVLELLRWCGAKRYYCARGSFGYMKEDGLFPAPDVEVLFQGFSPRPYRQAGSPGSFVPYLSILDALFNVGPAATADLVKGGTARWLSWSEMASAEGT